MSNSHVAARYVPLLMATECSSKECECVFKFTVHTTCGKFQIFSQVAAIVQNWTMDGMACFKMLYMEVAVLLQSSVIQ